MIGLWLTCLAATASGYVRWLIPLALVTGTPIGVTRGLDLWRRTVAPHRHGEPAARRAAEASFVMFLAYNKTSPFTRRRLLVPFQYLLAPASIVAASRRATRRHGREVQAAHGLSPLRQVLEQFALSMRSPALLFTCETADWYYRKRLYERAARDRAGRSIPDAGLLIAVANRLWWRKTGGRGVIGGKARQAELLRAASVPTIPILARLGAGVVSFPSGGSLDSLPASGLFAKPNAGQRGQGAHAWHCRGPDRYVKSGGPDEREWTRQQILDFLREQPVEYLLQPRLANHPDLLDLTGDTLCTARIVTYTDPATLQPAVFPAVWMKIPRAGAIVDNVHATSTSIGTATAVDFASGVLGPAFASDLTWETHHADRGSPIEGRALPGWSRMKEVALAAHRAFMPIGLGWGWDIALARDGPVVIEGNSHPGIHEEFFRGAMFGDIEQVQALIELSRLADRATPGQAEPASPASGPAPAP